MRALDGVCLPYCLRVVIVIAENDSRQSTCSLLMQHHLQTRGVIVREKRRHNLNMR